MADYTRLTTGDIDEILAYYDIGTPVTTAPLEGGQANSSFRIKTDQGVFTISVCDGKTSREIHGLTRLMAWLEICDFPTPRLVRTKSGPGFIQYQDKPVYIKTFIPGHVIHDLSAFHCFQVGQAMAALHSLDLPSDLRTLLPDQAASGFRAFDRFLSGSISHPFTEWLEKKCVHLEANLDTGMARSIIHGDIFWDNLVFSNEQLAAVLDFEEACFEYRLLDLAIAVLGCCAEKKRFVNARIQGLIAGYQTGFLLSDHEKSQLKLFIEYAGAATAFWRFCQYNILYPDQGRKDYYRELSDLADQVHEMSQAEFMRSFIP